MLFCAALKRNSSSPTSLGVSITDTYVIVNGDKKLIFIYQLKSILKFLKSLTIPQSLNSHSKKNIMVTNQKYKHDNSEPIQNAIQNHFRIPS